MFVKKLADNPAKTPSVNCLNVFIYFSLISPPKIKMINSKHDMGIEPNKPKPKFWLQKNHIISRGHY